MELPPKFPRDFPHPPGNENESRREVPRAWNVWTMTPDGFRLDVRGARPDPLRASLRAYDWHALGVFACVLPTGTTPDDLTWREPVAVETGDLGATARA